MLTSGDRNTVLTLGGHKKLMLSRAGDRNRVPTLGGHRNPVLTSVGRQKQGADVGRAQKQVAEEARGG